MGFHMKDPAAVSDRFGKTAVTFMVTCEQIESFTRHPQVCLYQRQRSPREGIEWVCLVTSINLHRVVRSGAAIKIPLAPGAYVPEGSWVDQPLLSCHRKLHAQSVCMTVSRLAGSLRSGVNYELAAHRSGEESVRSLTGRTSHHIHACAFKACRSDRRNCIAQFVESAHSFRAEQPQRFLLQAARGRLEIRTVIKSGPGRKRIKHVFAAVPTRINNTPSIIVAKALCKAGLRGSLKRFEHAHNRAVERCGNRYFVA